MAGVAHVALGQCDAGCVAAGLGFGQALLGCLRVYKPGAAEHHHGAFNACFGLPQVGLEHFELETDAARFPAEEEFRVSKSNAIGVGLQRVSVGGVCVQLCPGIGQAAFVELGVGFHGFSVG